MKSYTEAVNECCNLEEKLSLYDITICGIPIWRVWRDKFRKRFVFRNTNTPPLNNHSHFDFGLLFKTYVRSFFQFCNMMVRRRRIENVLFGFPRLEKIEGVYYDKFVDPLIQESVLSSNYLYLERGRSGKHYKPRAIQQHIIWTEFVNNTSSAIGFFLFPIFFLCYGRRVYTVYQKAKNDFFLSIKDYVYMHISLGSLCIASLGWYILFKSIGAKRFFAPALCLQYSFIVVCKKMGIQCYELQHGITTGPTTTYSGKYIPICYPDYFLAFGECSMNTVFGVPKERMINIGFAFKNFVNKGHSQKRLKTYLFLSDPEITEELVVIAVKISQHYPNYNFAFRLHPQELLPCSLQKKLLNANIALVDNSINSFSCVMDYEGVIGVNTTVLYEALSLGIKAAYIDYDDLTPDKYPNPLHKEFFYPLKSISDFAGFTLFEVDNTAKNYWFSDFDRNTFESILCKQSKKGY